jgi:hypothetical protein
MFNKFLDYIKKQAAKAIKRGYEWVKQADDKLREMLEAYEKCFTGLRIFSGKFNACLIQTTSDQFKLVRNANMLLQWLLRTFVLNSNSNGEMKNTPCNVFMENDKKTGKPKPFKRDWIACKFGLAGILKKLKNLDKAFIMNKFQFNTFGSTHHAASLEGKHTYTLDMNVEMAGLTGFAIETEGFAGLYGYESKAQLRGEEDLLSEETEMRAQKGQVITDNADGTVTYTTDLTSVGLTSSEDQLVQSTASTAWRVRSKSAQVTFIKKKNPPPINGWWKQEGMKIQHHYCQKVLNYRPRIDATVNSPGSIEIGFKADITLNPTQMAKDFFAAATGDLELDPGKYRNLLAIFRKAEEMGAPHVPDWLIYDIAVIAKVLNLDMNFYFHKLMMKLIDVDINCLDGCGSGILKDFIQKYGLKWARESVQKLLSTDFVRYIANTMLNYIRGFTVSIGLMHPQGLIEHPTKEDEITSLVQNTHQSSVFSSYDRDVAWYMDKPKCEFFTPIGHGIGRAVVSTGRAVVSTAKSVAKAFDDLGKKLGLGGEPPKKSQTTDFLGILKWGRTFIREDLLPLAIKGYQWFQDIRAAVLWVTDKIKQTGLLDVLIKAFNDAKGSAKEGAARRIQDVLNGGSFTALAGVAMQGIRVALTKPLVEWVTLKLNTVMNHVWTSTMGLFTRVQSFIFEEVLAEPVPLSQWGDEAIAAGYNEAAKAAYELMIQAATFAVSSLSRWAVTALVEYLLYYPDKAMNAMGDWLDSWLTPLLHKAVGAIKSAFAWAQDLINHVPKFVRDVVKWAVKEIYDLVMDNVAPEIKVTMDWMREAAKFFQKACNYATRGKCNLKFEINEDSLLQEQEFTVDEVAQRLKHAHQYVPRPVRPAAHEMLVQMFQPHRKEYHFFADESPPESELSAAEFMLQMRSEIRSSTKPSADATNQDVKQLLYVAKKLPQNLRELRDNVQRGAVHFGVNKHHESAVEHLNKAIVLVESGNTALAKVGWIGAIVKFLLKRADELVCLWRAGDAKITSVARHLRDHGFFGAAKHVIEEIWHDTEAMTKIVIQSMEATLDKIVASSGDEQGFTPAVFRGMVLGYMDKFSAIEPAIGCLKSLVADALRMSENTMNVATTQITNLFTSKLVDFGADAFNFAFEKVVEPLIDTIFGSGSTNTAKQRLGEAIEVFFAGVDKTVTGLFKKLDSLPTPKTRKDVQTRRKFRNEITKLLRGEKVTLTTLIPAGLDIIVGLLADVIAKGLDEILPPIYLAVMNVVKSLLLPAVTVGLDVAAASGSCATEWLATGTMQMVQVGWAYAQSEGKDGFNMFAKDIVRGVLNFLIQGIWKITMPIAKAVDAKISKATGAMAKFVHLLKRIVRHIVNLVPRSIQSILGRVTKSFFETMWKNVSPKTQNQEKLNEQLSKTLAWAGVPMAEVQEEAEAKANVHNTEFEGAKSIIANLNATGTDKQEIFELATKSKKSVVADVKIWQKKLDSLDDGGSCMLHSTAHKSKCLCSAKIAHDELWEDAVAHEDTRAQEWRKVHFSACVLNGTPEAACRVPNVPTVHKTAVVALAAAASCHS